MTDGFDAFDKYHLQVIKKEQMACELLVHINCNDFKPAQVKYVLINTLSLIQQLLESEKQALYPTLRALFEMSLLEWNVKDDCTSLVQLIALLNAVVPPLIPSQKRRRVCKMLF